MASSSFKSGSPWCWSILPILIMWTFDYLDKMVLQLVNFIYSKYLLRRDTFRLCKHFISCYTLAYYFWHLLMILFFSFLLLLVLASNNGDICQMMTFYFHRSFFFYELKFYRQAFSSPHIYLCVPVAMDYNPLLSIIILILCCPEFGYWEPLKLTCVPFWHVPSLSTSVWASQKMFQAHLIFSLPQLQSHPIYPRNSVSIYWKLYLETIIWVLAVFIGIR